MRMLRRERRTNRTEKAKIFGLGAATGAAALFFLDPVTGRRRRRTTTDRAAGTARRSWRRGGRAGRAVAAEAHGVSQKLQHMREEPKDYDDATLAHKVETVIFRDADVPKGQIDVNAQDGVVQLRGEVPSTEMLDALVAKARDVQGVREVESLLHLPGAPAPMHQ
jgi:osmotically-inducible protein OsmY